MWGVPSFTYANNCSRGLSCAVLMNMRVRSVGHTCSIGLTTGIVYCGAVGSFNRQDYVGIGDTVNLAARLMSKGDGEQFISTHSPEFFLSTILTRISRFLECENLPQRLLKSNAHMLTDSINPNPSRSLTSLSLLLFLLPPPSITPSLSIYLSVPPSLSPLPHRSCPSRHCHLLHPLERRQEESLPARARTRAQRAEGARTTVLLQLTRCASVSCRR
jgi:hypothetical protein